MGGYTRTTQNVAYKNDSIKDWQKSIITERMALYFKSSTKTLDIKASLRVIEEEL
jgi:hypothetical protein